MLREYVVPVFYYVKANDAAEARAAIIGTLEGVEYDTDPDEVGAIGAVLVGNDDEVTDAE